MREFALVERSRGARALVRRANRSAAGRLFAQLHANCLCGRTIDDERAGELIADIHCRRRVVELTSKCANQSYQVLRARAQ